MTTPDRIHACPPAGSGLMPCCGRTPFEAHPGDRITSDPAKVTCRDREIAELVVDTDDAESPFGWRETSPDQREALATACAKAATRTPLPHLGTAP